jgi:hypothetical protein
MSPDAGPMRPCPAGLRLAGWLAAMLLCGMASRAAASPLEDPTFGSAVFTGPTQAHATSFYVNPAALGLVSRGLHAYLGGTARLDQLRVERRPVLDRSGAAGEAIPAKQLLTTPSGMLAFYVGGDGVSGGVAAMIPYAETFADRDPFAYHTLGGSLYQYLVSVAVSFAVSDFFFGVNLGLGWSSLRLAFARDAALDEVEDPDCGGSRCGIEHPLAAERYEVTVATENFGSLLGSDSLTLSFGALYQLRKHWWIGLSYASPPGAIAGLGLIGDARMRASALHDPPQSEHSGAAETAFKMPQSVHLGLRGPLLTEHDLVVQGRWQNSSRHDALDLRFIGEELSAAGAPDWYRRYRGFRDVWSAQVGLEGRDTQRLRTGVRLGLETGAVADEAVSPLQVASWNASLGGGAELRLGDSVVLGAGYQLTRHGTVDVERSLFDPLERIDCFASQFDFDRCEGARLGRAIPSAAGRYERWSHALMLSLRYDTLD